MLEATDRSCKWTKVPGIQRRVEAILIMLTEKVIGTIVTALTDVSKTGFGNGKLWKQWKLQSTKKAKDPKEKRKNRRTIYQAKYKGERKGLGDVMWKDNQK